MTQGTLNVDPHDLIEPAFAALGRQRVLVVATTGRADDASLPFPAPPNARVAGLVPYGALLPRVDVVVTNGGWGGVLAALAAGIPLVVAGGDLDKPEVAARVAWSGAGVNLRSGRPSPRAVLRGWRRVSTDAAYRANAAAHRRAARRARRAGRGRRAHDAPARDAARRRHGDRRLTRCLAGRRERAYCRGMANLSERLAALVPTWGAKMAYGERTTLGGHDLVPVALVVFGFGGGEGSGEMPEGGTTPAGRGEGSGGGGGGYVVPIGAYVGGPDGLRFRPNPIAVLMVAVPLVSAVGWAVARIAGAGSGRRGAN